MSYTEQSPEDSLTSNTTKEDMLLEMVQLTTLERQCWNEKDLLCRQTSEITSKIYATESKLEKLGTEYSRKYGGPPHVILVNGEPHTLSIKQNSVGVGASFRFSPAQFVEIET